MIDDEIMAVVKLKLARGMILEFKADWTRNKLNPSLDEKKKNSFSKTYFQA
jgi:hypothetical protein